MSYKCIIWVKGGKDKNTGPQNFKSQGLFDPSKFYMGIAVKNLSSRAVYLGLNSSFSTYWLYELGQFTPSLLVSTLIKRVQQQ